MWKNKCSAVHTSFTRVWKAYAMDIGHVAKTGIVKSNSPITSLTQSCCESVAVTFFPEERFCVHLFCLGKSRGLFSRFFCKGRSCKFGNPEWRETESNLLLWLCILCLVKVGMLNSLYCFVRLVPLFHYQQFHYCQYCHLPSCFIRQAQPLAQPQWILCTGT